MSGFRTRTGLQAFLVGLVSALALAVVQAWVRVSDAASLFAGYRFQAWSSEEFMQEVKINDLLDTGPVALWYLHVQPPMLEGLRFLLSLPEYFADTDMTAQMIDERMYGLYIVCFGVLTALVYTWLVELTEQRGWALVGTVLFALYPGTLAMSTLLDGTFLSATLVTAMLLALFMTLRRRTTRWLNTWLALLLAVALTRTIFQLQILILVPIIVWAIYRYRIPQRTAGAIALSVVLVASLFALPAKQFALYDTTATTTFAGNHQIEVVSYRPTPDELGAVQVPEDILENAENFVSGFNSPENVRLNYVLTQVGNVYYRENPGQVVKNLIWGLQMNTAQAFKFTHEYSNLGEGQANMLVAALPWTPPMVNGISVMFYLLILFVTAACLLYAFGTRGLLRRARTYWPLLFVIAATMLTFLLANRYDWSEADRLKFILEPVFAVAFFSSLWFAWRARGERKANPDQATVVEREPSLESRPS